MSIFEKDVEKNVTCRLESMQGKCDKKRVESTVEIGKQRPGVKEIVGSEDKEKCWPGFDSEENKLWCIKFKRHSDAKWKCMQEADWETVDMGWSILRWEQYNDLTEHKSRINTDIFWVIFYNYAIKIKFK